MLPLTASATTPSGTGTTMRSKSRSAGRWIHSTGMVCNLVDLDGFVQREILERFDLENLNTLAEFAQTVPRPRTCALRSTIFCSEASPALIWKRYESKRP